MEFLSASFLTGLGEFFVSYPVLGFIILGFGFVVRGETAMLLSMLWIKSGFITWLALVVTVFVSLMIGDGFMFFLGKMLRHSKLNHKMNEYSLTEKYNSYFYRNFTKLLFLSKFTMGLTLIIMTSSGWSGVSFKRFYKVHFFAVSTWIIIMGGISYFLIMGLGYLQASQLFDKIEWALLGFVLLFISGEYLLQRMIRKESSVEEQAVKLGDVLKKKFGSNNQP